MPGVLEPGDSGSRITGRRPEPARQPIILTTEQEEKALHAAGLVQAVTVNEFRSAVLQLGPVEGGDQWLSPDTLCMLTWLPIT